MADIGSLFSDSTHECCFADAKMTVIVMQLLDGLYLNSFRRASRSPGYIQREDEYIAIQILGREVQMASCTNIINTLRDRRANLAY
jgi:hypothetical protein